MPAVVLMFPAVCALTLPFFLCGWCGCSPRLAVSVFTASLSVVLPRFRAFTFPCCLPFRPSFSVFFRCSPFINCVLFWLGRGLSRDTRGPVGVIASEVVYMRLICFSSVKCLLFSCGCFVFLSGFVVTVLPYARLCFCTCACLYARLCSFSCTGIAPAHCACFSPIATCCFRMLYGLMHHNYQPLPSCSATFCALPCLWLLFLG